MKGQRATPASPARWALLSLAAVVLAAAFIAVVPIGWLAAPAAGVFIWVGGAAAVSLLLGDHGQGRFFHGMLGLVFGIVLMLFVALFLHYAGIGITRASALVATTAATGVLVVTTAVFRRETVGVGYLPLTDAIAAVVAAAVLIGTVGLSIAIQDRPVHRFEVLTLIEPHGTADLDDRTVRAGGRVDIGFELRSHGYPILGSVRARAALGSAKSGELHIAAMPTDDSGTGFRGTTSVRAPDRAGRYRLLVGVSFVGPDGERIRRYVTTVVIVR